MSDIEARVKKIIAEQLGVEEGQVTSEKAFVADLGADSLAIQPGSGTCPILSGSDLRRR